MDKTTVEVRDLELHDAEVISAAFAAIGWDKPVAQYERYLAEQAAGERVVLVARIEDALAGYVTLVWASSYGSFRDSATPEIQDLNVLPHFRRRGIATRLMREAEALASRRSDTVGVGVGLHRDYGPAQRLYLKLGYVPDGRGLAYDARTVDRSAAVTVDDRLILYLTKSLPGIGGRISTNADVPIRLSGPTLDDAIALASAAHRGQRYPTTELGRDPFILHPLRVMLRLEGETDRVVGVLHDVVEDTATSLGDLRRLGYSEGVIDAVDAVSRRADETYDHYIERVATNPIASRVKLADLADNLANNRGFDSPEADRLRAARWRRAVRRLRRSSTVDT